MLEAQRRRADAQTSYFRTLLDYQRAIISVHFRKGSLLEYNNVYLAEGPWPAKAKFDAHRLARQRDASVYLNYGFTRPNVIEPGSDSTDAAGRRVRPGGVETLPMDGVPHEATTPEELPAPDRILPPAGATGQQGGPTRLRTASNGRGGFEWGPLGLGRRRASRRTIRSGAS